MTAGFWDERFSQSEYVFGEKPNSFVEERYTILEPHGNVLVLGDGEGRNGVFLARMGAKVTSVDQSEEGLKKAQALAKRYKKTITTIHGTLPDVELELGVWDAVVLIYLHLPETTRKAVHKLAVDALKPGGILLLEAFTPEQLHYQSGGPQDASRLYTQAMLKEDFKDLQIDGIVEMETTLHEGAGHVGPAHVVRVIAAKP